MTEALSYADLVSAGAAFLDDTFPGWRESINPSTLDMSHGERCLIGQLTSEDGLPGDYESWASAEGLTMTGAYRLGLAEYVSFPPRRYNVLTDAWREYLTDGYVSIENGPHGV